jgi:hypothetical protein
MSIEISSLPRRYQEQIARELYGKAKAGDLRPSAVSKRTPSHGALATRPSEKGHPAKYLVSVVSFRVRLLDEDNLCPKYHIDSLRYAGLLPADSPDRAHIITTQEKVESKEQERTEITIELIP